MSSYRNKSMGWDWMLTIIFFLLLTIGVINLHSAAFEPNHPFILNFNTLYGKQIIWIFLGLFIGIIISLIDYKHIIKLTPAAYITVIILLLTVLFLPAVNGSKSWLGIGSLGIQPSEFSKLTTALMLAFVISKGSRRSVSRQTFFLSMGVVLLPMGMILLQNDAGTFLVFTAFFFVMYREGITLDPILLFIANQIFGFHYKKTWIGIHFIPVLFVVVFYSILILYFTDTTYEFSFFPGYDVPGWIMIIVILTLLLVVALFFAGQLISKRSIKRVRFALIAVYFIATCFVAGISHVYLNVLQSHQKERIDLWLGKIEDVNGKDYNRNRAMAAVGSGRFFGRGYHEAILSGPQSNHVPESKTDFIFSVYSEEWGFIGNIIMVFLFVVLLIRVIVIAERQNSRFSRIYANAVAMILFYHFAINIGMNIGFVPVIGIPLPFFSYGGSSTMTFVIMIMVLLKLDSDRKTVMVS